jgi:hypothetical protein
MDDRNVFDFSGPEMSSADRRLFIRVRLALVAGLLFAMLVAALIAGPSRPDASLAGAGGAEVRQAKASPGADEAHPSPRR